VISIPLLLTIASPILGKPVAAYLLVLAGA
jgi:hypothetical protein